GLVVTCEIVPHAAGPPALAGPVRHSAVYPTEQLDLVAAAAPPRHASDDGAGCRRRGRTGRSLACRTAIRSRRGGVTGKAFVLGPGDGESVWSLGGRFRTKVGGD